MVNIRPNIFFHRLGAATVAYTILSGIYLHFPGQRLGEYGYMLYMLAGGVGRPKKTACERIGVGSPSAPPVETRADVLLQQTLSAVT